MNNGDGHERTVIGPFHGLTSYLAWDGVISFGVRPVHEHMDHLADMTEASISR